MSYTELKEAFKKLANSGYSAHVIKQYVIPRIKKNKLDKYVIDYCKELETFNSKTNYMPQYSKDLIPKKSSVQQATEEVLKVYNECISNDDVSPPKKSPSM